MSKTNREGLKKREYVVLKDRSSGNISKIIFANGLQVGMDDPDFNSPSQSLIAKSGISGSLTHLTDGSSYLIAGDNVVITTGSGGAVTIGAVNGASGAALSGETSGGIVDFSYTGGSTATVAIDLYANQGLSIDASSGLGIQLSNLTTATPVSTDYLAFYDTDATGLKTRKATISSVLSTVSNSQPLSNAITLGNGIEDSAGSASSYNNSAAVTLAVTAESSKGIGVSSNGVKIDPSALTSATVATGDKVIIGDVNDSDNVKYVTAQSIADLASVGTLTNSLTISTGLQLNSGTTFDGSAARTLSIDLANLTAGDGLQLNSGTTYDGTGAKTISIDLASNGGLAIASEELKMDVSDLSYTAVANNDYLAGYSTSGTTTGKILVSELIALVDDNLTVDEDWNDLGNVLVTTSSVSFAGAKGGTYQPSSVGTDAFIFFSGSAGSAGTTTRGTSTFGGDVVVTGTLYTRFDTRLGSHGYDKTHFTGSARFKNQIDAAGDINLTGSLRAIGSNIFGDSSGDKQYFTGSSEFVNGLSGSLTHLTDGSSYLIAGNNITIATGSSGAITLHAVAGGGGVADGNAEYLVLAATSSLSQERVLNISTGLTSSDAGAGSNFTISINDSETATISGSQFTGGVGFNSTAAVSGSLFAVAGNIFGDAATDLQQFTGSAEFKNGLSGSLTHLTDGSSYLVAGSNITVTTGSSGAVTIAASGGEIAVSSGSTTVSSVTTIDFSNTAILQDLGSGTVTLTGSIGPSEDGTYTDGLFTDFDSRTPIGTAVDRFNEVLKGLAPGAAPALDDMDCDDSGTGAVLSFGSSQSISGYTDVEPSELSSPSSNLSDININGTYSSTTSNNDIRIACFAGSTTIEGTLNEDVSADGVNYPANAFGNGDSGTLYLYINNNTSESHSVDLSSFGSGSSLNSNGSGFYDLSAADPGHFSDSSEFNTFKHRTGSFRVTTSDQRNGWNYARVTHVVGSTTNTCNYVEWVNDSDSNALASAGDAMDTLSMTGTKNLSGVKYNTGGTAQYRIRVTNAYRNVYSTSNISFNGTNCSVSSQAFPSITAGSEDESKVLHITGSATISGDPILNGSITVSTNVPAPLKSNLSSAGSQSISGILLYNLSDTSTTTSETFRGESYRLTSGSYNNQSDVGSGTWNSSTSLATVDGLLFYNSRLYAPVQGGASGDFRNTSDGGSIANGPDSNVNYSAITSGTRTFYRYFTNTSGGSKTGFDLTINGSGTIVAQSTSLSTSNLHVLIKLPNTSDGFSTGWMDLAVAFATGDTSDGDGCLSGDLDSSLNATNTATFGTESIGASEYVVVKIEADASFTGYISSMSVSWS